MQSKAITPEEAIKIMRDAGCPDEVLAHVAAVRELAMRIAKKAQANGHKVDANLVELGSILHDIGRSKTHGIDHAVIGAEIGRNLCFTDALVNVIERHVGAGIPKKDAVNIGLPPKDYTPLTLEEKIVAHADNLIGGSGRDPVAKTVAKLRKKGLEDAARRMEALHRELSAICGTDLDLI